MTRLIAAIDASAATHPLLQIGVELAHRLHMDLEAVHVDEGDAAPATAMARSHDVPASTVTGDRVEAIVDALAPDDVAGGLLGLRGRPGGRQPAGHTALEVMARTSKPLLLVPPEAHRWRAVGTGVALVPAEGTAIAEANVRVLVDLLLRADLRVHLLHVFDMDSMPRFMDQPQHDVPAWTHEFLARQGPDDLQLDLRVGHPDTAVLECARDLRVDLIGLACCHHEHPYGDSMVLEILAHAHVPVLLLPPVVEVNHDLLQDRRGQSPAPGRAPSADAGSAPSPGATSAPSPGATSAPSPGDA